MLSLKLIKRQIVKNVYVRSMRRKKLDISDQSHLKQNVFIDVSSIYPSTYDCDGKLIPISKGNDDGNHETAVYLPADLC